MTQRRKTGELLASTGYARILRHVFDGDLTATDLSERMGLRIHTARQSLQAMAALRLIHVKEWVKRGVRGRSALYAFGEGASADRPPGGRRRESPRLREQMVVFAMAIRALTRDEHHATSLGEAIGVHQQTATRVLRALHKQRLTHVSGYSRLANGGTGARMWMWGPNEPDVKRPPARSAQEAKLTCSRVRDARLRQARVLAAMVNAVPLDRRFAGSKAHVPARIREPEGMPA